MADLKKNQKDCQDIDHDEASFFGAATSKIFLKISEWSIDNKVTQNFMFHL